MHIYIRMCVIYEILVVDKVILLSNEVGKLILCEARVCIVVVAVIKIF